MPFRRELLISLAVLFGGVIAISGGLYVLDGDLGTQAARIVLDRALIAQRTQTISGLAELKRDSPQAKAYRDAMNVLLVTQDQLLDFPHWLDGLARSRSVALTFSFDPAPTMPQGDSPGFSGFSISVTGPIQNAVDFIRDAESRAPKFLVSLTNLDVTRSGSEYRIASHGQVYFK
ncbi:MAG: hypothetical protein Q8P49_00495 [Candidatus Liptonbacteria bacterium]|nr:hypothetical protein [Candidatus Liptonbacteria bacterium]